MHECFSGVDHNCMVFGNWSFIGIRATGLKGVNRESTKRSKEFDQNNLKETNKNETGNCR